MITLANLAHSRRSLQVSLGILATIPFASGLSGMLIGPSALPGEEGQVTATLDSEYRFVHAFWFATAPVIWSTLPRVERETTVLRVILGSVFLGGFGRLLSLVKTGRPHPVYFGALALELIGVPALLTWQASIARAAGPTQDH